RHRPIHSEVVAHRSSKTPGRGARRASASGNGWLPLYRPSAGRPPMEPYAAHSRGGTVPSGSSEPDGFGMVLIPASSVTPWLREDHIGGLGGHFGAPHLKQEHALAGRLRIEQAIRVVRLVQSE